MIGTVEWSRRGARGMVSATGGDTGNDGDGRDQQAPNKRPLPAPPRQPARCRRSPSSRTSTSFPAHRRRPPRQRTQRVVGGNDLNSSTKYCMVSTSAPRRIEGIVQSTPRSSSPTLRHQTPIIIEGLWVSSAIPRRSNNGGELLGCQWSTIGMTPMKHWGEYFDLKGALTR